MGEWATSNLRIGALVNRVKARDFTARCGSSTAMGSTAQEARDQLAQLLVNKANASDARTVVLTNERGDMVVITPVGNVHGITFLADMFRRSDMSDDRFEHPAEPERDGVARWNPSTSTHGGETLSGVIRWANEWLKREGR